MDLLPSLFTTPSLPLLFLLSFLAATILPIGSEWLLIVMIFQGFSIQDTVLVATLGNSMGAFTTCLLGIWGSDFIIRRIFRMGETQIARAQKMYDKFGSWSLLLSWLPVVGDPLCLLAGVFRVNFIRFSVFVFVGKFFRYAILASLARHGTGG